MKIFLIFATLVSSLNCFAHSRVINRGVTETDAETVSHQLTSDSLAPYSSRIAHTRAPYYGGDESVGQRRLVNFYRLDGVGVIVDYVQWENGSWNYRRVLLNGQDGEVFLRQLQNL